MQSISAWYSDWLFRITVVFFLPWIIITLAVCNTAASGFKCISWLRYCPGLWRLIIFPRILHTVAPGYSPGMFSDTWQRRKSSEPDSQFKGSQSTWALGLCAAKEPFKPQDPRAKGSLPMSPCPLLRDQKWWVERRRWNLSNFHERRCKWSFPEDRKLVGAFILGGLKAQSCISESSRETVWSSFPVARTSKDNGD